MSPQLWEAWSFRAETPPAAPTSGQEPTAGTGQAPTTASGQAPETTHSLAEVQAALQAARREAAAHRTENAALKKAQADAEAATLTEAQKVSRERDTLKAQLDSERLERQSAINRYEVQLQASKLGIVDPEAAVKLLDWESLEYADDGSPKGLEAALKKLLASKPYLAGGQQAPAGSTTNGASNRSAGQMTLADVRKMTPAQINARWPEVQAAMRRGV